MATKTEDVTKAGSAEEEVQAAIRMAGMKAYFDAQPKRTIKTREDEWVQINDYTFVIKAGEKVDVPEDVANLLEESGRI